MGTSPGIRALGLDPGTKRIGVAVSDIGGSLASPLMVIGRRNHRADLDEIAKVARAEEAEVIVVGLPIHMDGRESPSSRAARRLADELAKLVPMPVELHDERRTTAQAERDMRDAGVDGYRRRQIVDKVAAAIMLQSWLDARRHRLGGAGVHAHDTGRRVYGPPCITDQSMDRSADSSILGDETREGLR